METVFNYEQMGTFWKVTLYEKLSPQAVETLERDIKEKLVNFDNLFSRFKKTSFVYELSKKVGVVEVPSDLVTILRIYKEVYLLSEKRFTPCIGSLMEDIGYDSEYSLVSKSQKRDVPDFEEVVHIIDDTHIELKESVLFDIGAVGKGYCVDLISSHLRSLGHTEFLVDGSGDIVFESKEGVIQSGLEHPEDSTKVIGVVPMTKGAMCSCATNRRAWGEYSHYIDPTTKESPQTVIATWVLTEKAAYADALSSLLFFVAPEALADFSFEYCIMNNENKIKKSPGFQATFF